MLRQQPRWNNIAHCLDRRLRYLLKLSPLVVVTTFWRHMKKKNSGALLKLALKHSINSYFTHTPRVLTQQPAHSIYEIWFQAVVWLARMNVAEMVFVIFRGEPSNMEAHHVKTRFRLTRVVWPVNSKAGRICSVSFLHVNI